MPVGGKRTGSGRKPGRLSAHKVELAKLAQKSAPEALACVLEIMRDRSARPNERLSAATAILDRGFGRPFQSVHVSGPNEGPIQMIDPTRMSDAALSEVLAAMAHDEAPALH